jgi:hypothetical protein
MKDLSNVEVKQGDIVYYFEQESGDLEFGEVLQVSETSAYISQLRMVENEEGKQELRRLVYGAAVTSSPMIFVLPGASQRIPIREAEINSVPRNDFDPAAHAAIMAAVLA